MPSPDSAGRTRALTVAELAERPTVSVVEAARVLGVSKGTAYEMAKDGRLDVIEIGPRRWRVPTAVLLRMVRADVA